MNLLDIAFQKENPIYAKDLAAYKKDSRRALNGYLRRKGRWINTIHNTVTQYTPLLATLAVSPLIAYAVFT